MEQIGKKIVIFAGIAVVLILFLALQQQKSVQIATDKNDYQVGSSLLVNINNKTGKNLCFSSCYPYYLEKDANGWSDYDYGDCPKKDEIAKCVPQNEIKVFKINLSQVDTGTHRIKIPACVGCQVGQDFNANETFYSNLFEIK